MCQETPNAEHGLKSMAVFMMVFVYTVRRQ